MPGGWGPGSYPGRDPEVGETFVMGKDQQTARDLLDAAAALGLDSGVVRTVTNGFIIPDTVWDRVQADRLNDDDTGI